MFIIISYIIFSKFFLTFSQVLLNFYITDISRYNHKIKKYIYKKNKELFKRKEKGGFDGEGRIENYLVWLVKCFYSKQVS